jgi:rod shape-determining protein MreD
MKIWGKAGIIVFTLIIELVLANVLGFNAVKPDLMLIVVICLSFLSNSQEGIIVGFAGGLLKDIFSVSLLGTHALVKTTIGYLSGIIRERIFYQHLLWIITIATFFFTFLNNVLIYYLLKSFYTDYTFITIFKKYITIRATINCILAPLIYTGIKRLLIYFQRWS